ncbi:hypothetical protein B1C78_01920 [Thioalkalivibrio denitrificans]|uniref:Uncharacterized protein n=1 Tax=Thioalkalivibrio denitrificans TaxID=108003 RepID=A0A1V3NSK3_9GAMM|nr:hypothetical protein [Thioalkalivibrio denitrificans]OOG28099.1 hypothetical protein B1C78_01920 [Thioalkalivibrio denitrificans]
MSKRPITLVLILTATLWCVTVWAQSLQEHHDDILERIEASPLDEPIHLDSRDENSELRGEIHALVGHRFDKVSEALGSAADWCEIIFLHQNVKACVHADGDDASELRVYIGRKQFEKPDEATLVEMAFYLTSIEKDHLEVVLSGDRGPHGVRDLRMELEAIPSGSDRTLVRFRYALEVGAAGRFAMETYLATAGRDRVGFSSVDDNDELVRGVQGMTERNVMRFYLGVQAYLDTLHLPEGERVEARHEHWFDLTERYPEQLRELDKETYLSQKQRERDQQEAL